VIQLLVQELQVNLHSSAEAVAGGLNLAHFACTFGHARVGAWAVYVEPLLLSGLEMASQSTPLHVCASKGESLVCLAMYPFNAVSHV
jgi:hypothetical protein